MRTAFWYHADWMLRSIVLIFALLLATPASAQTADDAAANRLFVEAVQLWNRAEGESVEQRAATLQRVQANLTTIIEWHSGSALAVRLVIGESVGPLSVVRVDRAVVEVQERVAAAAEAEARAAAIAEAQARAARADGVVLAFRDCAQCPEMVVVPVGAASLASGRDVAIATPFAVGKFEVTFAEWDACVAQGGCSHQPDDRGWGRGRQPVMGVDWDDAQQYVAWLWRKTGKAYRLLSEAEWEYAAQAGSGREAVAAPGANSANCDGCGSRWDDKQTAPVGSFAANAFGLHDMLGNVLEWTADCWNDSHAGAPADDSARQSGDCTRRVLRGGSWGSNPELTRSARRLWNASGSRNVNFGFRVARTL
jgi:formylglycine-generating enzyme required for sulfatase activity